MNAIDPADRPPMNQEEYDAEYGSTSTSNKGVLRRIGRSLQNSYCYPFTGVRPFVDTVLGFVPILAWLPKYSFREDLMSDVVGGFTTGIMHVPQGIAYSALAGVDPVYGLYASCFPAFFYMFFGTSRHASIGSFAVVALMAGVANDRVMSTQAGGIIEFNGNSTHFEVSEYHAVTPIQVATTLTFAIGIWQLLCGLLRLQFLMTYFSDPLVSGFTTGAAVHVLLAQIDDLMGVHVPKVSGPGYIFVRLRDLAVRVPEVNVATLVISLIAMTFLYIGKEYFSPFVTRKFNFKLPIPYELILVATTAALSTLLGWPEFYAMEMVGNIPAGIPRPQLPTFSILGDCLVQSIGVAIVIIAVHISMAKMLGKKFNYPVDDNQELYAIGFTSLLGGCFPVYPVSTALGRTMVNVKSGTKTQLSTIFSCTLLMAIILFFGPYLRDLPKAIWVVSFACTAFIDVMEGLAISIVFALFTVIWRSQWSKWQYFYRSTETKKDDEKPVADSSDVCVFRFDGPLLFTNVERFKSSLRQTINAWSDMWASKALKIPVVDGEDLKRPHSLYEEDTPHFLVIDCSAIAYCDYMAACAMNEIAKEFKTRGGILYVAGPLREALQASGFFAKVGKENLFPTLKDAIAIASRNG
ncbi:hypothetical protein Q1695_009252 [Nippostrongylus brasiliensis]|nr:hypothetical protein Q1695_009252 [Nippostrongylus brasiliensis]